MLILVDDNLSMRYWRGFFNTYGMECRKIMVMSLLKLVIMKCHKK